MIGLDRGADRDDIFLCRIAYRAGASLEECTESANLVHFLFDAVGEDFGGMALARFNIAK